MRVVNLSLAGSSFSQLNAIGLCRYPNVLFVAAAGNDSRDIDAQPTYPCAYDLPNLICVGATDERDGLAAFSNHGPATIEIGAPGRVHPLDRLRRHEPDLQRHVAGRAHGQRRRGAGAGARARA